MKTTLIAGLSAVTMSAWAGEMPMPPGTIGQLVEGRAVSKTVTTVLKVGDSLNLRGRGLTALPADALTQTQIQSLYLDGNPFTVPPGGLDVFASLQRLTLNQCTLITLEGLPALPRIETLSATDNRIETLGRDMRGLASLRVLNLQGNRLATLPPAIASLAHLELLLLDDNRLTTLPEAIGALASLRILSLTGNALTTLPATISRLGQLESLDLSGNRLTALPVALDKCRSLKLLKLTGNNIPRADKNRFRRALPGCLVVD
ncbi:MAG: leucine-rich repeat domain-containing protein [bacterium]